MKFQFGFVQALAFAVLFALLACPRAGTSESAEDAVASTGSPNGVGVSQTELTAEPLPIGRIKLPDGFSVSIYAYPVPGARSLCISPSGTLFVGTRNNPGSVYAIPDANKDGVGDSVKTITSGLFMPNGVAFRNGSLYVAEVNRILRFDKIESRLDNPPAPAVVTDRYPSDEHHGWKFIAFGPDGRLYVPVGAPCNCCERPDPYASLTRIDDDGTGFEIIARGIRNTVGFDWDPVTGDLWFTDNGRDMLGDNLPPDELNHITRTGQHFGFPYKHGRSISDPDFGDNAPAIPFAPPEQELGPHVASLGMRFYTGLMFPLDYKNQIFIAEHGSWNRSVPIGARVTLVRLDKNRRSIDNSIFAEGWQDADGTRWGRPVDVLVMPDGALLVSDDTAGAVYRIAYR